MTARRVVTLVGHEFVGVGQVCESPGCGRARWEGIHAKEFEGVVVEDLRGAWSSPPPSDAAPFGLPISCLDCGNPVHLVTSTAQDVGTRAIAVVACTACHHEFSVEILMRRHQTRKGAGNGRR